MTIFMKLIETEFVYFILPLCVCVCVCYFTAFPDLIDTFSLI